MAGKHYLDWRDGWLCVVSEHADNHTPTLERDWWPVEQCSKYEARHLLGAPCVRHPLGYVFIATVKGQEMDIGTEYPVKQRDYEKTITLKDGGSTKLIHVENVEIPCPKVRRGQQTRWHYGVWQKWTTKGWVSA